MRLFLGVDQSLRKTGVVVLSEAGDVVLRRLVQPGDLRGVARLAFLRNELMGVLTEYRPVSAALEGYSYDSTGKVFELGEAGGTVKMSFWDAKVPFHVVAPSALKKFVANNHQASKDVMLRKTLEKWGVDFQGEDDLCDAHGLSRILRAIDKKDSAYRNELEVIHELTAPSEPTSRVSKAARSSKTRMSV